MVFWLVLRQPDLTTSWLLTGRAGWRTVGGRQHIIVSHQVSWALSQLAFSGMSFMLRLAIESSCCPKLLPRHQDHERSFVPFATFRFALGSPLTLPNSAAQLLNDRRPITSDSSRY